MTRGRDTGCATSTAWLVAGAEDRNQFKGLNRLRITVRLVADARDSSEVGAAATPVSDGDFPGEDVDRCELELARATAWVRPRELGRGTAAVERVRFSGADKDA